MLHLGPLPEEFSDELLAERQKHWDSCEACRKDLDERLERLYRRLLGQNAD